MDIPDLEAAEAAAEERRVQPSLPTSDPAQSSSFAAAFGAVAQPLPERASAPTPAAALVPAPAAVAGGDPRPPLPRHAVGSGANLLVARRQQGNPLLSHVRQVAWEYADIKPDFILSPTSAALFISIRYHLLHPQYAFKRMMSLRSEFQLRVLLIQIDVDDSTHPLQELCHQAVLNDFTAIVTWSAAESARYLETYKAYEKKGMVTIKPKASKGFVATVQGALGRVRGVNKTDALTLLNTFHSVAGMAKAGPAALRACPGLGEAKVRRLLDVLHTPFSQAGAGSALASNAKRAVVGMPPVAQWRARGGRATYTAPPDACASGEEEGGGTSDPTGERVSAALAEGGGGGVITLSDSDSGSEGEAGGGSGDG